MVLFIFPARSAQRPRPGSLVVILSPVGPMRLPLGLITKELYKSSGICMAVTARGLLGTPHLNHAH